MFEMSTLHAYTGGGCPSQVDLIGPDILCPGVTGFYRCVTRDLTEHVWAFNDAVDQFPQTDTIGETITGIPGAKGYLVERTGTIGRIGNRTTVVVYTPDASATSGDILIQCSGGGAPCTLVTRFIGQYVVYR